MIETEIDRTVIEKKCFSENFTLSLMLHKNGGVNGQLHHYIDQLAISRKFKRLYAFEDSNLKLAFIIDWCDPNLYSKKLTSFSGTILRYEGAMSV